MKPLSALFNHVWDQIERRQDAVFRPTVEGISSFETTGLVTTCLEEFSASKYLEESLVSAEKSGFGELSKLLRQSASSLVWNQNSSYSSTKLGSNFIENYVTGVLTGPEGNFAREAPVSGFLLLGPYTEYRDHSHAPREVYLVLTPGAEWRVDCTDWFTVEPGQVICHPSLQIHAIRTHSAPVLIFGAWIDKGDRGAIAI